MILTIPYPNIDPVFLRIGPVQLRWYGLMYMLSFIIGFFVLRRLAKYRKLNLTTDDLYDLLFYLILGVMVGGRLGYVLFYDLGSYLRDPLAIFKIWQGGMSFHGGFIGMLLAAWYITGNKNRAEVCRLTRRRPRHVGAIAAGRKIGAYLLRSSAGRHQD